jgi:hypothetical protein
MTMTDYIDDYGDFDDDDYVDVDNDDDDVDDDDGDDDNTNIDKTSNGDDLDFYLVCKNFVVPLVILVNLL